MNNKQKFETFLESLKGRGQDDLINVVKTGFRVYLESANPELNRIVGNIVYLMEEENKIKKYSGNVSEMEEATPEDLDAGYGRGMSNQDFQESLTDPYISIDEGEEGYTVYFYGNNSPDSVNAGRERKVFIASDLDQQTVDALKNILKAKNISVSG